MGRLSEDAYAQAVGELDELYEDVHTVGVNDQLVLRAAVIAADFSLRGDDAVHCASAELLAPDKVVMVSGDVRLLRACGELGLDTADTNPPQDTENGPRPG